MKKVLIIIPFFYLSCISKRSCESIRDTTKFLGYTIIDSLPRRKLRKIYYLKSYHQTKTDTIILKRADIKKVYILDPDSIYAYSTVEKTYKTKIATFYVKGDTIKSMHFYSLY